MSDLIECLRDRNAIVMCGLFHAVPAMKEAADEIERLRAVVSWVESFVSNPAYAYSHDALEGIFGMTRDKIAALAPPSRVQAVGE